MLILISATLCASAETLVTEDGFEYEVTEENTVTIKDYTVKSPAEIVIPETIAGLPVTAIADFAFYWDSSAESITLPDSVSTIGDEALPKSGLLRTFVVSDTNPYFTVCDGALYTKDMTTLVKLPYSSGHTEFTVPQSVTALADTAVKNHKSLETLNLPASLDEIYPTSIDNNPMCTMINVDPSNPNFESVDGVLFSEDKTVLWDYPTGRTDLSYSVMEGVTEIADYAFYGADITSVTVPHGLKRVGKYAFASTIIEGIDLPDTVTEIGDDAFRDNINITSIKIPDGVEVIGGNCFWYCKNLKEVTLPANLKEIKGGAFSNTAIESIVVPNGTEKIGHAFSDCEVLSQISLPDTLTFIMNYTFEETAFYNDESNWENGVLYNGTILLDAKEDISGDVNIKDGTTFVAGNAFKDCTELKNVTLPTSLKELGSGAFYSCTSLESVYMPENVINLDWPFTNCSEDLVIYGYKRSDAESYFRSHSNSGNFVPLTCTCEDSTTGIEVTAYRKGHGIETSVKAEVFNDAGYFDALDSTLGTKKVKSAFTVEVYQGEEKMLIDKMSVKIPLESDVDDGLYFIKDQSTAYSIDYTYEDGCAVFNSYLHGLFVFAEEETFLLGDVDLNGTVNIKDATCIQKYLAKLYTIDSSMLYRADTDGNGDVNIKDATVIQKHLAKVTVDSKVDTYVRIIDWQAK